jgi:hypothetical protein
VDEDEDAQAAPTDRAYWENKASKSTVGLADELLEILRKSDPSLSLKYNKFYIGLAKSGQAFNFVSFRPKKDHINLEIKLPRTDDVDARIESGGLEALEYNKRWGQYRIHLTKDDIVKRSPLVEELMKLAHDYRTG